MTEDSTSPTESAPPGWRRPSWARHDALGHFKLWLLVLFVLGMGFKFYYNVHDVGFAVSIAIGAGVVMFFLEPKRFHRSERLNASNAGYRDLRDFSTGASPSPAEPRAHEDKGEA